MRRYLLALALVSCSKASADVPARPGDPGSTPMTSGSRLKARSIVGADGSGLSLGLYDSKLEVTCAFVPDTAGALRCLPFENPATQSGYLDPDCKEMAYLSQSGCPSKYTSTPTASPGACAAGGNVYRYSVVRLTAVQPQPTNLYARSGAICAPTTLPMGWTFYTGTPVSPAEFVAGELRTE